MTILEQVDSMQEDVADTAENVARRILKAYVDAEYDPGKAFESAMDGANEVAAEFLGVGDVKKWAGRGVLRTEAATLYGDPRQYAQGFQSARTVGQSAAGMASALERKATGYLLAELRPQREELGDAVNALYQEVTGRGLSPELRETADQLLAVYAQLKGYQGQREGLENLAQG